MSCLRVLSRIHKKRLLATLLTTIQLHLITSPLFIPPHSLLSLKKTHLRHLLFILYVFCSLSAFISSVLSPSNINFKKSVSDIYFLPMYIIICLQLKYLHTILIIIHYGLFARGKITFLVSCSLVPLCGSSKSLSHHHSISVS